MDELKKSLKDFLRIKNYSKHTISNYERDINRFLKYLNENKIDPDDVSTAIITGWIIFLRREGLSNRSIQRNISSLKNFYKYLKKLLIKSLFFFAFPSSSILIFFHKLFFNVFKTNTTNKNPISVYFSTLNKIFLVPTTIQYFFIFITDKAVFFSISQ